MKKFPVLIIVIFLVFHSLFLSAQKDNKTIKKFNRVIKVIESQYVDTVNSPLLVETAIKAMLKELDPHSSYLSAESFRRSSEALKGSFAGVGFQYQILHDTLMILKTVKDGPAEKTGLLAGDKLIAIDDEACVGSWLSPKYLSKKLRGKQGSSVILSVVRRNPENILRFKIEREQIPIHTLDAAYLLDKKTAYIKINGFSFITHEEFVEALAKLKNQGAKNLILDLRGNPGGLMKASIKMADEFLNGDKLLVYTEGAHSKKKGYYSKEGGLFIKGKLIVLINEYSASASEIFAGAIQDFDRGILMGRRSFGKGMVGRTYTLTDGSAIRLITGHYYTPTGRCIQKSYQDGTEEYKNDLKNRYKRGELFSAKNIQVDSALSYKTYGGRLVFGGGGITPDIFFPLDTTGSDSITNILIRKGILNAFAGQYFDWNMENLHLQYPNIEKFKSDFAWTEKDMQDLQSFVKTYYHIELPIRNSWENDTQFYLRAFLARNLYPRGSDFLILNQRDKMLKEAQKLILDNSTFKKHGIRNKD